MREAGEWIGVFYRQAKRIARAIRERGEYYEFFGEVSDIYEIISPDAFLRPHIDDYDTLARIYRILKEAFEAGILIDKEFMRKTAKLVQTHTHTGNIKSTLEVYEIDENTLRKLEESSSSDTEKVFNLLRTIGTTLAGNIKNNPYLISIAEKAEEIAKLYKLRQKGTQATLDELKRLIEEINTAKEEQTEKNMPTDVFSIYWVLKGENVADSEDKANQMKGVLAQYPHWMTTEEHERKVKQELHKVFIKSKIEIKKSVELATKIIRILKGATG